jgi:SnoaL-like domain
MKKIALLAFICAASLCSAVSFAAGKLSADDYMEIQQLYATYNNAIDGGDAEGWASTFTPDGVFNTFNGHEALIGFIHAWRDRMGGATRKHWNTNLHISGDSKEATGTVYLMLIDTATKPISIIATGTYADTLVKTKDGWRFSKRTTKMDTAPAAAAAPAAPAKP